MTPIKSAGLVTSSTGRDLTEEITPWRFCLLLLLLIAVTFPDAITCRGTFFTRDFGLFTYPIAYYQKASLLHREIPLWDPLSRCGIPFLAQWNTAALYPPSLFYLVLPLAWSLSLFCLGHLLLAGMGMYFLAYSWTQNRFAAAVAGTAFTFSALLLNCLVWISNLAAIAWMPWLILVTQLAIRDGGRRILTAGIIGALQMLSGAPEPIFLTWVFLTALLVQQWFTAGWRFRVLSTGRFLATIGLVAALSAAQLLPFINLLIHSDRNAGHSDAGWPMPSWGWGDYFVPLFRTVFLPDYGIYSQTSQFWVFSYYLGLGTVALGLFALWRVRSPRVIMMALLTLASILLANGSIYSAAKHILPALGVMRYPVKFVIMPALLVPLLAAFSVKEFVTVTENKRRSISKSALFMMLILCGVVAWLVWLDFHDKPRFVSWLVTLKSGASRMIFLFLIVGTLLCIPRIRRERLQGLMLLVTILLFWGDLVTAMPRGNPVAPHWIYEPNLARKESAFDSAPETGESRLMLSPESALHMTFNQLPVAAERYTYARLAMFDNCNLLDGIPKVDGFFSIHLNEPDRVLTRLEHTNFVICPGLLDFLAVSQVTAPGKSIEWMPRPTHLAWATAGQKPVFTSDTDALAGLFHPDFDPKKIVYLSPESRSLVTVSNASSARVLAQHFSAHKVQLQVEAPEPAMVVIAQSFYHLWHGYVDGKPVAVLRANQGFQALEVPEGKHEIVMVYEDKPFRVGATVSLATLSGVSFLFLRRRRFARP